MHSSGVCALVKQLACLFVCTLGAGAQVVLVQVHVGVSGSTTPPQQVCAALLASFGCSITIFHVYALPWHLFGLVCKKKNSSNFRRSCPATRRRAMRARPARDNGSESGTPRLRRRERGGTWSPRRPVEVWQEAEAEKSRRSRGEVVGEVVGWSRGGELCG